MPPGAGLRAGLFCLGDPVGQRCLAGHRCARRIWIAHEVVCSKCIVEKYLLMTRFAYFTANFWSKHLKKLEFTGNLFVYLLDTVVLLR
jgi:hypothetical protein